MVCLVYLAIFFPLIFPSSTSEKVAVNFYFVQRSAVEVLPWTVSFFGVILSDLIDYSCLFFVWSSKSLLY